MRSFHGYLLAISVGTVLALLASESTSGEDYCKWTDENGVVHFAEKCPENVESATIATESERTESQIKAAEEHTKSLLTEQAKHKQAREIPTAPESKTPDVDSHQSAHDDAVDFSQMSADQLEVLCEEEREKRLAPEREQLIQDCINIKRKSPGYCERHYSDYGAAAKLETGNVRPALYMDLPECVAAWEARRR